MARKVNKHGLKIEGLKLASEETERTFHKMIVECFYNIETGNVWCVPHDFFGLNGIGTETAKRESRTSSPAVVKVNVYFKKASMQQIADDVAETVFAKETIERIRNLYETVLTASSLVC